MPENNLLRCEFEATSLTSSGRNPFVFVEFVFSLLSASFKILSQVYIMGVVSGMPCTRRSTSSPLPSTTLVSTTRALSRRPLCMALLFASPPRLRAAESSSLLMDQRCGPHASWNEIRFITHMKMHRDRLQHRRTTRFRTVLCQVYDRFCSFIHLRFFVE